VKYSADSVYCMKLLARDRETGPIPSDTMKTTLRG
jgi:hypothetical protein